jgi:hypothetical protein
MAREARAQEDLGHVGRLRAAGAAVDDRDQRDERAPGLVARQRDGDVVEAGGPRDGDLQGRPRAVGDGVAHLRDGHVELGRGVQPDAMGLGGRGNRERRDEHGEHDPAHALVIPPQIDW